MILVTGATGFVGSEIVRRASRRGWRVRDELDDLFGRAEHADIVRRQSGDGDGRAAVDKVVVVECPH